MSHDSTSTQTVWDELVAWVQAQGGHVHRHLALQIKALPADRGIFATNNIAQGDLLIQIPSHCVIDGREHSAEYQCQQLLHRKASHWLRCLAALHEAQHDTKRKKFMAPYLNSLPGRYDTVWEWSDDELSSYLAGTHLVEEYQHNDTLLRERYQQQIRPYFLHENLVTDSTNNAVKSDGADSHGARHAPDEQEFQWFYRACQCLSTRGFHASAVDTPTSGKNEGTCCRVDQSYRGPYLLPVVDLLNHSQTQKCTTLHCTPEGDFWMRAERDIHKGEELFHSYGDDLTSGRFLQTFGFVPQEHISACLEGSWSHSCSPAILSKSLIRDACQRLMKQQVPHQIAASVNEDEEDVWDILPEFLERTVDFVPDALMVTKEEPLTDELVTLCCAFYLPPCAYREASNMLLDASILDDYYLGKLVCGTLLQAVQTKLGQYPPSAQNPSAHSLLRSLCKNEENPRRQYALCIVLEERECLSALVRSVSSVLSRLEGDSPMDEEPDTKRACVSQEETE